MTFTEDWFSKNIPVWEKLIDKNSKNVLEIGSFEGRSCLWFCENLPDSHITCIDTFEGSLEHSDETKNGLKDRFDENTEHYKNRISVLVGTSDKMIRTLEYTETFDVVYIDGSHWSKDVLTDAILVWPLVKNGGLVIFDDYMWPAYQGTLKNPQPGIHVFLNLWEASFDVVHVGYQLILKKKTPEE